MRGIAHEIANQYSNDSSIKGVLIFGSVVSGNVHKGSDLDIVVIEDSGSKRIERLPFSEQGVEVDLWKHSFDFYEGLFSGEMLPSEIFHQSMFLGILQSCEILYDPDSTFETLRSQAEKWVWHKDCVNHLLEKRRNANEMYEGEELDEFESLLFSRKIVFLDTCIDLMKAGLPVSNRAKDLYMKNAEHFQGDRFESVFQNHPSHNALGGLIRETMNMFEEELPERKPFTELSDAVKHHKNNKDFMAVISLQNGAFYVGRFGLRNRNVETTTRGYIYPDTEIELIRKAKNHWSEFYALYKRIHNIG